MLPQVYGGAPQQMRMQSAVRILFSFLFLPNTVALTNVFCCFFFFCLAGHADETGAAATQALIYKLWTLGLFLFRPLTKVQASTSKEAQEKE